LKSQKQQFCPYLIWLGKEYRDLEELMGWLRPVLNLGAKIHIHG